MADAIVETGMKDAGYEYIVLDDCWQVGRDKEGRIIVDEEKFPSGMKALGDYIHAKGLKFGIYSCAGRRTCQRRPGSKDHQLIDAQNYAEWGVDYLKYDWCYHGCQKAPEAYAEMRDALHEAGRPVVFSICEWGTNEPWEWGPETGHLWRTTRDIRDCWDCNKLGFLLGWTRILDQQVGLEKYAKPGAWNDPDMLEVGNGGMTTAEYRAHFSLWCMLAAPLMAGNDLRNMDDMTLKILTNQEAIALNQDVLGKQGWKARDDGDFEVWIKPLAGREWGVCLFNRSEETITVDVKWAKLGIKDRFQPRDLWKKEDLNTLDGYSGEVPGHDVVLLRLQPLGRIKLENKKKGALANWFEFYVTAERGVKILAWFTIVICVLLFLGRMLTTFPYMSELKAGEQAHVWITSLYYVAMGIGGFGLLKVKKYGWTLSLFANAYSLINIAFPPYEGYEPLNLVTYAIGSAIFAIPICWFLLSKKVRAYFKIEKLGLILGITFAVIVVYSLIDSWANGGDLPEKRKATLPSGDLPIFIVR